MHLDKKIDLAHHPVRAGTTRTRGATRRSAGARWLVVVTALVLLAGCASRSPAADNRPSGSATEVTVDTATGEVAAPVTTERIWALDEHAALQLIALGVTPIGVGRFMDDGFTDPILAEAGLELSPWDDVEGVAAATPNLIVGSDHPEHLNRVDRLERVAPVILPRYAAPWADQLAVLGEVTGTGERASALAAKVEAETRTLAAEITRSSDLAGGTVSMAADYTGGTFVTLDQTSLPGLTLERLGFERPAAQVNDDDGDAGFIEFSGERLGEHGGDIVLSLASDLADTGNPSVLENPVFGPQVEAAAVAADVEHRLWVTTTVLSSWWILQDLRGLLLDDGRPAGLDAVPDRWADLMSGL
jgi:iron complex transport system substrate-binding protein